VRAKIFITGDVHGNPISRLSTKNFPEGKDLTRDDIVIITGDFGVFFCQDDEDDIKRQLHILKWLDKKPFTTLFIGGNHENWDTLNALPLVDKYGVKMGQAAGHVFFIPNGTLFEFGGRKIFCFGGAMSTDRGGLDQNGFYPEEGRSWWRDEIPSKEQMDAAVDTLESVDWKVDLVITHTMSSDCVKNFVFKERYHEVRVEDPVARFLNFVQEGLTYDKWYCGHFHVNKTYETEAGKKIQVLYDYIVKPDDSPLKHYGRVWVNPLW